MNAKKAKEFRRQAKLMAGDKYNWKGVYKFMKKMEKNRDAAMAKLKTASDQLVELSQAIQEREENGSNTTGH